MRLWANDLFPVLRVTPSGNCCRTIRRGIHSGNGNHGARSSLSVSSIRIQSPSTRAVLMPLAARSSANCAATRKGVACGVRRSLTQRPIGPAATLACLSCRRMSGSRSRTRSRWRRRFDWRRRRAGLALLPRLAFIERPTEPGDRQWYYEYQPWRTVDQIGSRGAVFFVPETIFTTTKPINANVSPQRSSRIRCEGYGVWSPKRDLHPFLHVRCDRPSGHAEIASGRAGGRLSAGDGTACSIACYSLAREWPKSWWRSSIASARVILS